MSSFVKLHSYEMLEICALAGVFISFLVMLFASFRSVVTYFLLWFLYLSIIKVGSPFLFQGFVLFLIFDCFRDFLLLEAGFIAIMLANFNAKYTVSDRLGMWLLRWLLFRIIFSSGIVCLMYSPLWWDLKLSSTFYYLQVIFLVLTNCVLF